MRNDLERIHKDLEELKKDVGFIKRIIVEEYELSNYAKNALKKARKTAKSKYVSLDELD